MDAETDVLDYLSNHEDKSLIETTNKTKDFLSGYYSNFALELLSTVDYISLSVGSMDEEVIKSEIEKWSDRKENLFANDKFVGKALSHLNKLN